MSASAVKDASSPVDASASRGPLSALVVDDDASVRSLIQYVLRRESFEVEIASSPDEALTMLEERVYDVVVLDLRMNDPRALRILESLRERRPRLLRRVVIVSAAVHLLRHGLPAKVCRVLAKPFNIEDLVAAVSACAGDES